MTRLHKHKQHAWGFFRRTSRWKAPLSAWVWSQCALLSPLLVKPCLLCSLFALCSLDSTVCLPVFISEQGCGPPPQVKHADVQFSSMTAGSVAVYVCHSGFTSIPRTATSVCGILGKWSQTPVCEGLGHTETHTKTAVTTAISDHHTPSTRDQRVPITAVPQRRKLSK